MSKAGGENIPPFRTIAKVILAIGVVSALALVGWFAWMVSAALRG